jgi:hypothetical protein
MIVDDVIANALLEKMLCLNETQHKGNSHVVPDVLDQAVRQSATLKG